MEEQRQYWWANQAKNYEAAIGNGTLWGFPVKQRPLPDRHRLKQMRVGDVVVHYARPYVRALSIVTAEWIDADRPDGYPADPGDPDRGWLVRVEPRVQELELHYSEACEVIGPDPVGPFRSDGIHKRGVYIAQLSESSARELAARANTQLPSAEPDSLLGLPADR